jgi:hypothetical protein
MRLDLFLSFHNLVAFVIAAFGTCLVRHLGLEALRANARGDRLQEVVRPAFAAA